MDKNVIPHNTSNTPPLITVLMAVFNGEEFLRDAIDSILNQTFTNFEFLIINDCSTDNSNDILLSYADTRMRIVENTTNLGLAKSLNLGLTHAKGDYIARMDADDIALPQRIEKQLSFMQRHPDVGFCGTWFTILGTNELIKVPEKDIELRIQLLHKNQFGHPTVMFRKLAIENYKTLYDENYTTSQDYDLWTRLIFTTKAYNYPESLLTYRIHASQTTAGKTETVEKYTRTIIAGYLANTFGNIFTTKEQELHYNTMSLCAIHTIDDVRLSLAWLKKLWVINSKQHHFDKQHFNKFIQEREYDVVMKFATTNFLIKPVYSIRLFYQFIRLPNFVLAKVNWNSRIRFAMKCLLHIKKV